MSLRRRLVLGLLVLVGLGLVASDFVTYAALSSYLNGRVDSQLENAKQLSYQYLSHQPCQSIDTGLFEDLNKIVGSGTQVQIFSPEGNASCGIQPQDVIPTRLAVSNAIQSFETGSATNSGIRYRATSEMLPGGDALVVAVSLQPMNETLSRLVVVEVIVSLVVLAGLAALAWWLVRVGLRPLDGMTKTAGKIADGDLTQRVTSASPRTEVGQLGRALNVMLSRIESAFSQRKASEERLRRFVADASHELRTPLTSIRGYAELFRRGASKDPRAAERAMARIESEAARMSTMVDDLLLLARLDQGRPLESRPVDIAVVAAEAVEDARVLGSGHDIGFFAPGPVVVRGDETRIRQVLSNLLSNAIKHTDPGTPVHVEVSRAGKVGVLEVSDQGAGIEPEAAERIFERFYRADSARMRGGSGLGLSIVAAVVEAHGGRATVSSVQGEGSTFRVELPLLSGPGEERWPETGDRPEAAVEPAATVGSGREAPGAEAALWRRQTERVPPQA